MLQMELSSTCSQRLNIHYLTEKLKAQLIFELMDEWEVSNHISSYENRT